MKTVIHIIGARPNFIKASPVIREMNKLENINNLVLHTGQHYDKKMSEIYQNQIITSTQVVVHMQNRPLTSWLVVRNTL